MLRSEIPTVLTFKVLYSELARKEEISIGDEHSTLINKLSESPFRHLALTLGNVSLLSNNCHDLYRKGNLER